MGDKVNNPGDLEAPDRRAALRAIGKYATAGAGASIVVLSSADAVKAQSYNGCANGKSPNCP